MNRYRATTDTADKHAARDIEARERSRILEGRHGIRRQPDITFKTFAEVYLRDHAELHKRSVSRDREILKVLNRSFGSLILHEITTHRIEQFQRERLAGKWRGHNTSGPPRPIKPATVNRELDTLKSLLSKAVEWGKLLDSPARAVKRLRVELPARRHARRHPISPAIEGCWRCSPTNHTFTHRCSRHTALSRMIAGGYDDYTVMSISGHSSTRMLARYTHPTEERKIGALNLDHLVTSTSQCDEAVDDSASTASEIAEMLKGFGGRQEARTPDLRVANAALSQLS
jgi:integrase